MTINFDKKRDTAYKDSISFEGNRQCRTAGYYFFKDARYAAGLTPSSLLNARTKL